MKKGVERGKSNRVTPGKKRLFFIIMILIPIFFFLLLELSLRIFNYGPDLSLFKETIINDKTFNTLNPSVKYRYFSQTNFKPDPSPENLAVPKPQGTFRIFCLGGSTTVGFPFWYNGSFPSFLRDRLKAIFPNRSIEIINIGMTATNSYTVLDLAKVLVDYQPDLFIVYDGHNEFYGALGVASNESGISERWMAEIYLKLIHLRTFQLVNNIVKEISGLFGKPAIDYFNRQTLMEQVAKGKNVPFESSLYKKAFNIFKENLNELAALCRDHNIPQILGTQASNLKDQSPFMSNNSPGLSQQGKTRFQQLFRTGVEVQSKGLIDSAIAFFHSAISVDSFYAAAHYHLAQCLYNKNRRFEAYKEFVLARDYDELRFRTDSRFNNLIRSMDNHKYCFVADIEKEFERLSPDSLLGYNLIFEHLHPVSKGNFYIAKEYAGVMRKYKLLADSEEWAKKDTINDEVLWNNRHITEVDEYMAKQKINLLTAGWPFRSTYQAPPVIPKNDTLQLIANLALHDRIGWITAHNDAAEFYLKRSDYGKAAKEYETIINQIPLDETAYNQLAQIYFAENKFEDADSIIKASLKIAQTPFAYRLLGDIFLKQRKPKEAVQYYNELSKFPEDPSTAPENAYMLAFAYLKSGKTEMAISLLEQTANRYPAYKPVRELLSKIMSIQKSHQTPK